MKDNTMLQSFIKDIFILDDQGIIKKWDKTPGIFNTVSENQNIFSLFGIKFKRLASNEIRLDPPKNSPIWIFIDDAMV